MGRIAVGKSLIETVEGDITQERVDVIVNAANTSLLGGGGVDGAIHRAGGPAILTECRKLNGCATGDAKITTAGHMPAQYVIHTVGPIYHGGNRGESDLLASCHRRSLEVALDNACKTVSFPAISCGVYGYPIPEAARIATRTVKDFIEAHPEIERARFVLFGAAIHAEFEKALQEIE